MSDLSQQTAEELGDIAWQGHHNPAAWTTKEVDAAISDLVRRAAALEAAEKEHRAAEDVTVQANVAASSERQLRVAAEARVDELVRLIYQPRFDDVVGIGDVRAALAVSSDTSKETE